MIVYALKSALIYCCVFLKANHNLGIVSNRGVGIYSGLILFFSMISNAMLNCKTCKEADDISMVKVVIVCDIFNMILKY